MASILALIEKLKQEQSDKANELFVRLAQHVDKRMNLNQNISMTEMVQLELEKLQLIKEIEENAKPITAKFDIPPER